MSMQICLLSFQISFSTFQSHKCCMYSDPEGRLFLVSRHIRRSVFSSTKARVETGFIERVRRSLFTRSELRGAHIPLLLNANWSTRTMEHIVNIAPRALSAVPSAPRMCSQFTHAQAALARLCVHTLASGSHCGQERHCSPPLSFSLQHIKLRAYSHP